MGLACAASSAWRAAVRHQESSIRRNHVTGEASVARVAPAFGCSARSEPRTHRSWLWRRRERHPPGEGRNSGRRKWRTQKRQAEAGRRQGNWPRMPRGSCAAAAVVPPHPTSKRVCGRDAGPLAGGAGAGAGGGRPGAPGMLHWVDDAVREVFTQRCCCVCRPGLDRRRPPAALPSPLAMLVQVLTCPGCVQGESRCTPCTELAAAPRPKPYCRTASVHGPPHSRFARG